MARNLTTVLLTALLVLVVLFIYFLGYRSALIAVLAPAWITILVIWAMFTPDVSDNVIGANLPATPDDLDDIAFLTTLYDKTTQMHIETDHGMYQLISIFVGASVIILGWVAAGSQPEAVTRDLVALVGSLAVVLVGVATLLKHRLRYYNKLREVYLRRLETLLLERNGVKAGWGPHNFMREAASAAPTGPRNVSFHAAIDIYYFIYILIWILLYMWKT